MEKIEAKTPERMLLKRKLNAKQQINFNFQQSNLSLFLFEIENCNFCKTQKRT